MASGVNGGHATLTTGYYWTPADYASGAIGDTTNETDTRTVAIYDYTDPNPYSEAQEVKQKNANQLGLYDMSGNV